MKLGGQSGGSGSKNIEIVEENNKYFLNFH